MDNKNTKKWPADAVSRVKISDLKLADSNARTHSDAQVKEIAASMREWGWTNPVLVDESMTVIAGHGRLMAAELLGITDAPVMVASGWTDAQCRAYALADNQLAMNAGWDDDILKMELKGLKDWDFDLSLLGFDNLDELLAEETEGLTDPDAVPDIPEEPVTKLGDVWLLGNHRLMCGDSTSIDAVEKLMDGQKANICFTSPPYNVGSLNIKGNSGTSKKYNSFDDNQSEKEFTEFLTSNINCMMSVCDEVFYNIGLVQNNKRAIFDIVHKFRSVFKDVIYWKKSTVAPHIQKGVVNNLVEFILCFGDGKRKFLNAQFRQGSYWNVIEGKNASGNDFADIHKATFPVYLPENIIENFTSRNSIVVDCFGGVGTTMIACEMHNRNCRMMELDEKYCDVIIKRWQGFTGKNAVLESTGEEFDLLTPEEFDK